MNVGNIRRRGLVGDAKDVPHFKFRIALTDDNSTEYVPVLSSNGIKYTMSVDWGDGSVIEEYTNQTLISKSVGHQYTGVAGDEFVITLYGTEIPALGFAISTACNVSALVEVVDNTLECDTQFRGDLAARGGFYACKSLRAISANALQNNTYNAVSFNNTAITSFPDGLFSHLTKEGVDLVYTTDFLAYVPANISLSQMNEIKNSIKAVDSFAWCFYGIKGTIYVPDDFFDRFQDGIITSVRSMFQVSAANGGSIIGDAKKLYDVLSLKVTTNANTQNCFTCSTLSNRDQVPTSWGGTMS